MSTINRTIIEIHALETTAAGNLNRDDTGSPKTVEYGGTTRARVSSQAWKRPTRELFKELVDPNDLGIRTKRVVEELTGRILECRGDLSEEQATMLAETVLQGGAGIKLEKPRKKKADKIDDDDRAKQSQYLLFLGNRQYDQLADLAIEATDTDDPIKKIRLDRMFCRTSLWSTCVIRRQ